MFYRAFRLLASPSARRLLPPSWVVAQTSALIIPAMLRVRPRPGIRGSLGLAIASLRPGFCGADTLCCCRCPPGSLALASDRSRPLQRPPTPLGVSLARAPFFHRRSARRILPSPALQRRSGSGAPSSHGRSVTRAVCFARRQSHLFYPSDKDPEVPPSGRYLPSMKVSNTNTSLPPLTVTSRSHQTSRFHKETLQPGCPSPRDGRPHEHLAPTMTAASRSLLPSDPGVFGLGGLHPLTRTSTRAPCFRRRCRSALYPRLTTRGGLSRASSSLNEVKRHKRSAPALRREGNIPLRGTVQSYWTRWMSPSHLRWQTNL